MNPNGNPQNFKGIERTPEQEIEIRRKGGIASGKARREKKMMSRIYADFLAKKHKVVGKDGITKEMEGDELLSSVMSKILSRGDSSSVSLMREIREATEGTNIKMDQAIIYLDKQDAEL